MDSLLKEVGEAMEYGVGKFFLFPKVDNALKSNLAAEAYNPEGITPGPSAWSRASTRRSS